jgi:hypothetical protein
MCVYSMSNVCLVHSVPRLVALLELLLMSSLGIHAEIYS